MKNLKKLLPLFALILGFGLVFTQSAFKPTANPQNHQYAKNVNGEWIEIDDETYVCNESDDICKGTFSYSNPLPNEVPDVSIDQDMATYVLRTP